MQFCRVSGDAKVYQFDGLKLNAGKTDLKGDIRISLAGDTPQIVATLVSQKMSTMQVSPRFHNLPQVCLAKHLPPLLQQESRCRFMSQKI